MRENPVNIVLVEDSPDDAYLINMALSTVTSTQFEVDHFEYLEEALQHLTGSYPVDVVLLDLSLPDSSGLETIQKMYQHASTLPIIILTGNKDEAIALKAMQLGAQDYLTKQTFDGNLLARTILYAIERKQITEQLRQSETRFRNLIQKTVDGMVIVDQQGLIRFVNPAAEHLFGYEVSELLGQPFDYPIVLEKTVELEISPPEGETRITEMQIVPIRWDGEPSFLASLRDITERKKAVEQMQRQERLAAVGQLAAGIAHDFNNIIAVISIYAEIMLRSADLTAKEQQQLQTIQAQTRRAADLTQQILDFSRQSLMAKRPIELVPFLKEFVKLLKRTMPEHIQIQLTTEQENYLVKADTGRLQQVFMNLALNARDAMPDGGLFQIKIEFFLLTPQQQPPFIEMTPGEWLKITVSDSGTGIKSENLSHIFEPFFSSKSPDKGTGLGLAQVHGIIKQHDGFIDVASQWGKGTQFILYLPTLATDRTSIDKPSNSAISTGHGETILLVEDDEGTREAIVSALELLNYEVLVATNGHQALKLFETHTGKIALVLSDIVMPGMRGEELFGYLKEKQLDVKVILMTGYPLENEGKSLLNQGIVGWIQKPFQMEELAQIITETLQT